MTAPEIAASIVASEPFMWLMAGSGHPDLQLAALRPAYEAYKAAGGATPVRPERPRPATVRSRGLPVAPTMELP